MKDFVTIKDVLSSKLKARAEFKKGTFLSSHEEIIEIVRNGAIVEFKAQEFRDTYGLAIEVLECRIYFPKEQLPDND